MKKVICVFRKFYSDANGVSWFQVDFPVGRYNSPVHFPRELSGGNQLCGDGVDLFGYEAFFTPAVRNTPVQPRNDVRFSVDTQVRIFQLVGVSSSYVIGWRYLDRNHTMPTLILALPSFGSSTRTF